MEPEAKYTLVGTVVLALLALLAAAVVWLRTTGEERDDLRFKIYFERQSLDGLPARGDVKMRGIRVGTVTGFRISSSRPGAVEVLIRVDGTTPVRRNTAAVVERRLVTGIASILLVNPNEDSPPLTAVQPGEIYPVIAEGESQMQQVSESVNELAQRTAETLQRINAALSPQNQRAFTEVLENLRRISASADRNLAGLERTLASVSGAADEVRAASRGIGEDAHALAARYDKLGAESTVAVRDSAASIRQMSADVSRLAQRVDGLVASGDMELRVTAQELRATADSLRAAAHRLGDPRSVLFGPPEGALGPGEGAR